MRADDLAAEARRLGLPLTQGERRYDDGRVLTWRQLGIAEALTTPGLPYFFAYDDDDLRLGARAPRHDVEPLGITAATIAIDPVVFARHTAGADLPITFVDGSDGLRITIALANGTSIDISPRARSSAHLSGSLSTTLE